MDTKLTPERISGIGRTVGRTKQWHESLRVPLAKGTTGRLDAVRGEGEDRLSVIREAIDRELRRRERQAGRKTE